jgi:transposase
VPLTGPSRSWVFMFWVMKKLKLNSEPIESSRFALRKATRRLSQAPHSTGCDCIRFRSGRQFAAWLGLTPLQKSSGGKGRLGRITKMGDKYLRKLLIVGMTSLVRRAKYNPKTIDPCLADLLARKPVRVATVAMANKTARIIRAIMVRGETYRAGHQPALAA